jgi:hypothetical protein
LAMVCSRSSRPSEPPLWPIDCPIAVIFILPRIVFSLPDGAEVGAMNQVYICIVR